MPEYPFEQGGEKTADEGEREYGKRSPQKGTNATLPPSFPHRFIKFGTFFAEQDEVQNGGHGVACAKSPYVGVRTADGGENKYAYEQYRRADEIINKGLFFEAHRIEHARRDHGKAHRKQDNTAFRDEVADERLGKCEVSQIAAERVKEGDKKYGDKYGDGESACEILIQAFGIFAVEILGKLGDEHEGKGTDDRRGDKEHGHRHAGHDTEKGKGFGVRCARADEHGGQEYRNGGIDERAARTDGGNGQCRAEKRLELLFGLCELAAEEEEADGGGGEGKQIGDDDRPRGAVCAVHDGGNVLQQQNARDDHDRFLGELENGGGEELFVAPKAAANDGVQRGKDEPDQKDTERGYAPFVGEKERNGLRKQTEDKGDGEGEKQTKADARADGGAFAEGVVFRFAFGNKAGDGDGNTARADRKKNGKKGKRDLIQTEPFRADQAGEYDTVEKAERAFGNRKYRNDGGGGEHGGADGLMRGRRGSYRFHSIIVRALGRKL